MTGAQAESLRPFQALSWESNRFSGVTTQGQIYFYKPGDLPAKVYRLDLSTGHKTLWKELMPSDSAGVSRIGPILITPDGKSCLYGYHRILSDLYLVEGLK